MIIKSRILNYYEKKNQRLIPVSLTLQQRDLSFVLSKMFAPEQYRAEKGFIVSLYRLVLNNLFVHKRTYKGHCLAKAFSFFL